MATTTLVGTGVIVLLVLWLLVAACAVCCCSAQGSLKMAVAGPLLVAIVVTIVLVSMPKGLPSSVLATPAYSYSYGLIVWPLVFTGVCVALVASLLVYFVSDVLEPHYAHVAVNFRPQR